MSIIFGKSILKILSNHISYNKNVQNHRLYSLFRKSNNVKSPYIIVRATIEDYDEILKLMHESYYEEEPTISSLKITPNPILDQAFIQSMTAGYTLVAKCKCNGCIVGACINESTSPWDPDLYEKLAYSVQSENVRKLIIFQAYLMRAPDIWRTLGIQKVFEMSYLFVKRRFRQKGLASRLIKESKTLGVDAGFPVIRCDATNAHTARICERLGMQKIAEIPYRAYLNQRLEPIFKPPWPHEEVKEVKEVNPYIIVRATKDDFCDILSVMHESYYESEPTVSSLKIQPNSILDHRTIKAMSAGYTLAKCRYNNQIVGACIGDSTSQWDADLYEKLACSVRNEDIRKLIMFYAYVMRAPDLWRCLAVSQVYEISYLFVQRSHRKTGLAYRLLKESKSLGADAGFPVIRCDATSAHTAKICERIGMQKVAEIPYCSYLDQNLEPIFKPPWPHQAVKIYCDCAPQYNELKNKIQKRGRLFKRKNNEKIQTNRNL